MDSLSSKNKKIDLYPLNYELMRLSNSIMKHGVDELDSENFKRLKEMKEHLNSIIKLNPDAPKKKPFMGTYPEKKDG